MSTIQAQPGSSRARGLAGPPLGHDLTRERANPLGAYLRARRELTTPDDVGIITTGVRRVPGLRREELAMLAGISVDYYLRLERGRDRHPSGQVLEALARALRLDQDHIAHLQVLARRPSRIAERPAAPVKIPASALRLLDSLEHPAFIEDPRLDILMANAAATALNPRLAPGRNQLRDLLLDPDEQALHTDREASAACLAASLRYEMGGDIDDPRYTDLVDELNGSSPLFGRIWARHDVRAQRGAVLRLNHPQAGPLSLNREQLGINGAAGSKLVIYHRVAHPS